MLKTARPVTPETFPPDAVLVAAYAGIGSRQTPRDVITLMERLGRELGRLGWTLRTGLAQGADQAFHRGALNIEAPVYVRADDAETALREDEPRVGNVELYLPWPGFEAQVLRRWTPFVPPHHTLLQRPDPGAYTIAAQHHPAWRQLRRGARHLHARNSHQVLGADLTSPSAFVICWTPDGSLDGTGRRVGGTGQALRLANAHGIPVFNLARPDHRESAESFLERERGSRALAEMDELLEQGVPAGEVVSTWEGW